MISPPDESDQVSGQMISIGIESNWNLGFPLNEDATHKTSPMIRAQEHPWWCCKVPKYEVFLCFGTHWFHPKNAFFRSGTTMVWVISTIRTNHVETIHMYIALYHRPNKTCTIHAWDQRCNNLQHFKDYSSQIYRYLTFITFPRTNNIVLGNSSQFTNLKRRLSFENFLC